MGQPEQRLFTVTKKNGELGMGEKIVFFFILATMLLLFRKLQKNSVQGL